MLNCEVDMEDSEMQRIQCDIVEEEIPPTPEHTGTSAQDLQVIEINDTTSDEDKEDYHASSKDTTKVSEEALMEEHVQTDAGLQREQHAQPDTDLQKEDERKDPPIEPDRPPPDKNTKGKTRSPLEVDNRTKSAPTRQQQLSKHNKNPLGEDRISGTSPEAEHAKEEKKQKKKDLVEKILQKRKCDAVVSVEPSIKNNNAQEEAPTPRQLNDQAQLGHDNKKARHLARVQTSSPKPSTIQSYDISSANIISTKRPLRRTSKELETLNIAPLVPGDFIYKEKATQLYRYLMSWQGQKECGG
jgi:hypothetical protein